MNIKRISLIGVFIAMAMLFSYVESLVPSFLPVPGARIGLANIVILLCLYTLGPVEALTVGIIRIVLSALLFGNLFSLALSCGGFVLSFSVMCFLYKSHKHTIPGISAVSGAFHNFGQIIVASFIIGSTGLMSLFVLFAVLGIVTGIITGIICKMIYERTSKYDWLSQG